MPDTQPPRRLTLLDSTSLVVGIVIGAGVYQMAPDIARGVNGPWSLLVLWLLGGALSLAGALCYAELATAYPASGGDYVYLTRAYGPSAGFLFGWAQLAVVRPGDIAVMAFAFATYAHTVLDPFPQAPFLDTRLIYATGAVLLLTAINVAGVRESTWTQNVLTFAKATGLLVIVGAAFLGERAARVTTPPGDTIPAGLALVFVLFSYGGWNEMAYVAAEVRNPRRNIARALVLGMSCVTVLYLLLNLAFLHALGFAGVQGATAVATETVATAFPLSGATLVAILICISALGATNGLIFTGARISFALGRDHAWFQLLGRWHPRLGTPAAALTLQGAIAILLILVLGHFINAILYTAAVVYSFYTATTLALLVLRHKDPTTERPFRVPGYPWTPLAFAAVCLYLIRSAVGYKPAVAAAALSLLLLGIILWRCQPSRQRPIT